ncbi:MAG: 3-phosphoshikimate 1-carboxyvinyltransferase [Clostridia bacterium]|nr:3-phosphoshikimate 1-carboxyvinyltransferase [Clostridia bacterium]
MNIHFEKSRLSGAVKAPPSKSMAHRYLICAALANGESTIRGISDSKDISATLSCLSALGVCWERDGDTVRVHGKDMKKDTEQRELFCNESGSTLRFFIPLCMLSGYGATLSGSDTLMSRPLTVYEKLFEEKGLPFEKRGDNSLFVGGKLKPGEYRVAGNVSSQFISGLLFVLPLLGRDSVISIIPPIESEPYLKLTVKALEDFGVKVEFSDELTIKIKGNQRYQPQDVTVEGDYSNAAFLEALNLFDENDLTVTGLSEDSLQGDRIFYDYFDKLRCGMPTLYIGNCPDLGPVLMAIAAAMNGAVFCGTHRLKMKESDRGAAMAEELAKFGVAVNAEEDSIVVYPANFHAPEEPLDGHNDHRIVMALSTILCRLGGTIRGAQAVEKSYPEYFDTLKTLGAVFTEEEI